MTMTKERLVDDLRSMGLQPHDTVLLHTSMKKIGPVAGGPDAVLDMLMDYFSEGLLCFPALSWTTAKAQPPAFDVLRTPSIVGILPELFRQRPGVVRSWNPTHSMAAFGRDAQWMTREDHLSGTPCGPRSSWRKLMHRQAWIVMAGCDLTSCTFLHGVEEWCGVPGRIGKPVRFQITLPDGQHMALDSAPHTGAPSQNYWKIEAGLKSAGLLCAHTFGRAPTMLINAQDLYAYAAGCLSVHQNLFG